MIEIPESVETWEETEKTIGETLPVIYGADAATLGWIRQWNEVIEADCPLYYDEELAQRLGYKTIPAPAGMAHGGGYGLMVGARGGRGSRRAAVSPRNAHARSHSSALAWLCDRHRSRVSASPLSGGHSSPSRAVGERDPKAS